MRVHTGQLAGALHVKTASNQADISKLNISHKLARKPNSSTTSRGKRWRQRLIDTVPRAARPTYTLGRSPPRGAPAGAPRNPAAPNELAAAEIASAVKPPPPGAPGKPRGRGGPPGKGDGTLGKGGGPP